MSRSLLVYNHLVDIEEIFWNVHDKWASLIELDTEHKSFTDTCLRNKILEPYVVELPV